MKNDLCLFPFNITVIQVYAPTSNAEEAEWFYDDLQDLLELTPKKDVLFIIGDWHAKVGSQGLEQELAHFFFCKGTDSKYFGLLWAMWSLSQLLNSIPPLIYLFTYFLFGFCHTTT